MKKHWLILVMGTFIIAEISIYSLKINYRTAFPESCHYQFKYDTDINGSNFKNIGSVTLLTTNAGKSEISIVGSSNSQNASYHINRVIYFNVSDQKDDDLYVLTAYKTIRKNNDTIPDEFFALLYPSLTSSIILQIEKAKDNAYLITTQTNPLPICITKIR